MKKLLFLLLMTSFFAQVLPAQQCTCNPNGWQTFTALINNKAISVKCGYQFSLTCNDTVVLRGSYTCIGNCAAKYSAVLKNNTTGVVVQTYASFTFPWSYHFTAAGNYSLEIIPLCGNSKCTPCRFFFTVTCRPTVACECNPEGWQSFIAYFNNGAMKQTVRCGFQFSVKKQQPFKLAGAYRCIGNCTVKYAAVLKNNVTGALVQNYPSFSFPWTYTFTSAGNYKLEITPICGEKRCQPCVFYFTVD